MKNNKLYIGTMTMNFGEDIPGSILAHNLKRNFKDFNVIVADGNLTESAKEKYKKFNNVKVLDSKWQDSHIRQYQAIYNELKEGDWLLYLDDDENMSPQLQSWLARISDAPISFGQHMYLLPCVLFLTEDGCSYYPAEPEPPLHFSKDVWTKSILVRKCGNVFLQAEGSHVQFRLKDWSKAEYLPYPYQHFRDLKSFVDHDAWQMYLSPRGQGLSELESAQFKLLTKQFSTMKQFKTAAKDGSWPLPLQKFAWDHRRDYNRPISRLFWLYHILNNHPCIFGKDNEMTWENVKKYVQSEKVMQKFEESKSKNLVISIERC